MIKTSGTSTGRANKRHAMSKARFQVGIPRERTVAIFSSQTNSKTSFTRMLERSSAKTMKTHLAPSVPALIKIINPLILSNKCDPLSHQSTH